MILALFIVELIDRSILKGRISTDIQWGISFMSCRVTYGSVDAGGGIISIFLKEYFMICRMAPARRFCHVSRGNF